MRNKVAGAFITFEGIDGSGKSTQMRLLAGVLRQRGRDCITTREPGGTNLGRGVRALLLDAQEDVDPLAELLLFAADRAQHVRKLLRPAIAAGHIVLSDRYSDATIAYQGAGRNFTPELIAHVVAIATEGLKPDLTLVFNVTVEAGRTRTSRRGNSTTGNTTDRLDAEDASFHERVRRAYLQIAEAEPERVRIVEASRSIEETHAQVLNIVMPFLETRKWNQDSEVKRRA